MKKVILSLSFLAMLSLALVGCNKPASDAGSGANGATPTQEAPATDAPADDVTPAEA